MGYSALFPAHFRAFFENMEATMDRAFTAKAMGKVLGYGQFGKNAEAKAWLDALLKEIDPQGNIARATAALKKDEDIQYLAERGYWPKLIEGKAEEVAEPKATKGGKANA